jgi:pimeloyl-ACP methyl ester carboxylesterase
MMKDKMRVTVFLVMAVIMLASCNPKSNTQASIGEKIGQAKQAPAFLSHSCWMETPENIKVICGYVVVPEDRSLPLTEKNSIRIAVAVYHSSAKNPAPDPVLYQVGGPGGYMLWVAPHIYDRVIAPFLETRDLILFDPRGTGFSLPALECKDGEEPGDCIRRLTAEGRNTYAYNSSSMAADLQDIRLALGYDQWNLVGESYGTHVAQIAMREQPEGLRSVVLDSVVPVTIPTLSESTGVVALKRLLVRCESDSDCRRNYPNLSQQLEQAISRLNQSPVSLEVTTFIEDQQLLLTGERMKVMIVHAMYESQNAARLPQAISNAAAGSDYSFWYEIVRWEWMIHQLVSQGVYFSVSCGDGKIKDCTGWPLAIELEPVESNIPVLILNGEFDPVTPVEYGHAVAEHLPNSFVFDFPGMGHWINNSGHPCEEAIISDFLANPQNLPDAGCIDQIKVVFSYPELTHHVDKK